MIGRLVALLVACSCVMAGPLDPPPGTVFMPVRTLQEAEPRTPINPSASPEAPAIEISTPGSYFLTGNVIGTPGNYEIVITANNVTLDLRGFGVVGVPGSLVGINVPTAQRVNIRIFGGTVRGWGGNGIDVRNCLNSVIEDVQASGNGGNGIVVGAGNVRRVQSRGNGLSGIRVSGTCTIRDSFVSGNAAHGIDGTSLGAPSILVDKCIAELNNQYGMTLGDYSMVVDSIADRNKSHGILVGQYATVSRCAVRSSLGRGIIAGSNGTILDCAATGNGSHGVETGHGAHIARCTATGNGGHGLSTFDSCTISGNLCNDNAGGGIYNTGESAMEANTCVGNTLDGIRIGNNNRIVGNTAMFNAQAGINAEGSGNVIDSNFLSFNIRGLRVIGVENSIFRNAARENSLINYDIVGGNDAAPVGTLGASANPWLNLSK